MLDHVFTDAIDALRQSLEKALLERLAVEEHLTHDMLSGDLSFETSYGLLGEETPPRVRADISMVWSTWSQSAFREWYVGEGYEEPPKIDIEITLRVQRLVDEPDPATVLAATSKEGPVINGEPLLRDGPTVERAFNAGLGAAVSAFEVAYGGTYELSEKTLQDSALIDVEFATVGGWIASTLVRLGDLGLTFGPSVDD